MPSQQPKSKFTHVFDAHRQQQPDQEVASNAAPNGAEGPAPRGRAAVGKRSNPAYLQISAHIGRHTKQRVERVLFDERQRALETGGSTRDFGDVIEEALLQWLERYEADA